jgi:hypothetical protein
VSQRDGQPLHRRWASHTDSRGNSGPRANLIFRKRVAEMSSRPDNCRSQSDLKARVGVLPAHVCVIMAVLSPLGNELT